MRTQAVILASAIAAVATPVYAHPVMFGVLIVRESASGDVDVTFRFSGTEARAVGAEPSLPETCRPVGVATSRDLDIGGVERRLRMHCGIGGLASGPIAVRGMEGTGVQISVSVERADGNVVRDLFDDAHRELVLSAPVESPLVAYGALGVEHILFGVDHLLFVLGLVLLVREARMLALTITAFTLGHSVTLALAALGHVSVPRAPIEALIAASILMVAVELARPAGGEPTLIRRSPWTAAFGFGLLHGLGFASALVETGLPTGGVVPALVGFNLGVELGQLAFIAACIVPMRWVPRPGTRAREVGIVALGGVATYFFLSRLVELGAA